MDPDALQRKRRTQYLIIAAFAAIAVVVALVLISQSGGDDEDTSTTAAGVRGASEVKADLDGIPQSGTTLGDSSATVAVIEYGDLQCPICRGFATQSVPQLISQQVRPGNVTYEYRNWDIIDEDSEPASKAALAAGEQDRFFNFIQLFYANQGKEGSGYVNDQFLTKIAEGAGIPDIDQWNQDRRDPKWDAVLKKNDTDAQSLGFTGTPSILVTGPKGQRPLSGFGLDEIQAAIQQVS